MDGKEGSGGKETKRRKRGEKMKEGIYGGEEEVRKGYKRRKGRKWCKGRWILDNTLRNILVICFVDKGFVFSLLNVL